MNRNTQSISAGGFILCLLSVSTLAGNLPAIEKSGPTTKVIQLDGPCDWASWDPATAPTNGHYNALPGSCGNTAAQAAPGDPFIATGVLGQGLGYSFEETNTAGKPTGKMIVLFGDTIGFDPAVGLYADPAKALFPNFHAKDTLAWSTSTSESDFMINYYALPLPDQPDAPLFITEPGKEYLPPQPSGEQPSYIAAGTNVSMGPYDIPNSGISLYGQTYLIINSGKQISGSTSADYSVLVNFDGASTFTTGRTVSETNYNYGIPCIQIPHGKCLPFPPNPGHFVFDALAHITVPGPCVPIFGGGCISLPIEAAGIYGNGQFRASSLYFSYVPADSFETGLDSDGNPTTQYFAGYAKDGTTPQWTSQESEAQPLFWDNPPTFAPPANGEPDPGTVGNASLFYNKNTELWMMIYDGGRSGGHATTGIYFTYAAKPWGPWQKPQLIYNACQAHEDNHAGYGDIIFYYTEDSADSTDNWCNSALDGINGGSKVNPETGKTAAWSGPAGPIIGTPAPFGDKAFTTRGGEFAPQIIARFSGATEGRLTLQYTLSTWNPYTVVVMETDFTIAR